MAHRLSVPFPLLHPYEDDESSPSDSSHSTPRSSFLCLDPSDPQDHIRRRPFSLASFDSGYFSIMGKESPVVKSSSRRPSRSDLRSPLIPINVVLDATHESPKREGVIMSFLRKKKKSLHTPSPDAIDPFPIHLPHRNSPDGSALQVQSPPFSLPLVRSNSRDPSVEAFEGLDRFSIRRGMKYHPYSREDAPYMLSYDRVLLDNDKYTDILLRRLNQTHTPSFHDFPQGPPRSILDLGCGAGGWAVYAALYWPSSQVIGFDLLNPTHLRGNTDLPSNLQWRQGNFVKYKLPFPKNTFDLVRMADLSLCIPYDRWEHVLSEVRRVLTHGGRLELIDDYLHFPYTKHPPEPSGDSHGISSRRPSSSAFDEDDNDEVEGASDAEGQDDDDDDFVSTKSRFSSLVDTEDFPPSSQASHDPVSEWHQRVDSSRSLESVFEDMLSRKFSIHPKPSKIFDNAIDNIFGRYNQRRLHEFNLYLAPPPCEDCDDSSGGSSEGHSSISLKKAGKDFAKWMSAVEWDRLKENEKKHYSKGDRSSEESLAGLSTMPDAISAKAAGRLGIQVSPTHSSSPRSHPHPTQSPGLILWPATFIPIAPMELEMHACKHLHSLVGSKAAINEYLEDVARSKHLSFDQRMVDDLIWDYECFRRRRFNWPTALPDTTPMPITTTPRSNTFRSSLEPPYQSSPRPAPGIMGAPVDPLFAREKLDFVRSIKVYSATKNDEEIHVS